MKMADVKRRSAPEHTKHSHIFSSQACYWTYLLCTLGTHNHKILITWFTYTCFISFNIFCRTLADDRYILQPFLVYSYDTFPVDFIFTNTSYMFVLVVLQMTYFGRMQVLLWLLLSLCFYFFDLLTKLCVDSEMVIKWWRKFLSWHCLVVNHHGQAFSRHGVYSLYICSYFIFCPASNQVHVLSTVTPFPWSSIDVPIAIPVMILGTGSMMPRT